MSSPGVSVVVIVEGLTEQTFVRDVLAPYMGHKLVYMKAINIGGDPRFERVQNYIRNYLRQRQFQYVTTMFDFFGIGCD